MSLHQSARTKIIAAILAIVASFSLVVRNGAHSIPHDVALTLNGNVSRYMWKLQAAFDSPSYYVLLLVILAFVAFLYLIPRINWSCVVWTLLFSVISTFVLLLCDSYYTTNSWDKVFGSWEAAITSLIRGSGIAVLVFFTFDAIARLNILVAPKEHRSQSVIWSYIVPMAVMLLCWAPYMIILAPGSMSPDSRDQFGQVLHNPDMCWSVETVARQAGDSLLTNHHPVFHTLVLGIFLKLGQLFGSYFVGILFYSILQCFIFSWTLVFCVTRLRAFGMSAKLCRVTYLFFVLCPLFPLWGMTILKDTPFCILLLLVTIVLFEVFRSPDTFTGRKFLFLGILLLLLMLFRNNGFYIVLLLVPFAVLTFRKNRRMMLKVAAVLLIPLVVYKVGYTGVFFNVMHINEGSPREMLSVPFQQTARYIKEYPDDVTPREEAAITAVIGGGKLSLEDIARAYTPDRADSVKGRFNKYATGSDLERYFETWGKQFVRHPDVYIEALFNLDYSWFTFNSRNDLIYYNGVADSQIPRHLHDLDNPKVFASARSILQQGIALLDKIPVVSALFEFSTYTWLYVIFFISMVMRRKTKELMACLPLFFNMAICFIGPVAYMRYAIPLVACLPLVLFITFARAHGQDEVNENKENEIWIR